MRVLVGEKYYKEKRYALSMLLNEFLGLNIVFESSDQNSYTKLLLDNNCVITIEDHFFHHYIGTTYLHKRNIPIEIDERRVEDLGNMAFLSLYGPSKVIFNDKSIVIKGDIIAATFFMLTRWEEAVIATRDRNGRFPANKSLAVRFNFLHRPIVNEYSEILWSALKSLDKTLSRKQRKFNFLLTHDVDLPRLWWSPKDFIKSIGGALVKRKNVKEALTLTQQYIAGKDPFNVFDWMMDTSEKYGFTSHFFFMSGGTSDKDNYYKISHNILKELMNDIMKRGHKIGFHPSFNAYNDRKQFAGELELLRKTSGQDITTGRHHFLRFEVPTTWQIWEDEHMEWDSTMSFHDKEGFRCGVCYPFPVFNIHTREQLKLIERPLTVMEGSFITYQHMKPKYMEQHIKNLIDIVKSYDGEFVFLWHNSAFRDKKYNDVYKNVLEYASIK